MNTQQIKAQMSKGAWEISALDGTNILSTGIEDNYIITCDSDNENKEVDLANAEAIVSAVNSTYGNNINPDKVKEMFDMLGEMLDDKDAEFNLTEYARERVQTLLTSAKLS